MPTFDMNLTATPKFQEVFIGEQARIYYSVDFPPYYDPDGFNFDDVTVTNWGTNNVGSPTNDYFHWASNSFTAAGTYTVTLSSVTFRYDSSFNLIEDGSDTDTVTVRVVEPPPTFVYIPGCIPCSTAPSVVQSGASLPGFCPPMMTSNPVRYADGVAEIAATDLTSSSGGVPWGITRSWSNGSGYAVGSDLGAGWSTSQIPQIHQVNGSTSLVVTLTGTGAMYFDLVSGNYVPRFGGAELLAYDSGVGEYALTDATGGVIRFDDFNSSKPPQQRGLFKSHTDAAGNAVAVTDRTDDGNIAEVQRAVGGTITESFLYSYAATGAAAGLLESVTLRRKVGAGAWQPVRSVEYGYYGVGEDHGNPCDLKTVEIKDDSGVVIDTSYYRYYQSGDANGYARGLQFAFGGAAYRRLVTALGDDLDNLDDEDVSPFADNYFEYDGQQRVTKEVASGEGCSACAGGQGEFGYSFTSSMNAAGMNSWSTKTVETLPDGNTNTIYTNAYGLPMLTVYEDVGTSQEWITYYQYDAAGRVVLQASPSAVTGYNDGYADLVHFVSGNAQYLSDSAGLIVSHTYGSSTTATSSTAGDVTGYLKQTDIQQGETGTAIPQASMDYFLRSVTAGDFYHVASETVYRNDNGTGGRTTSYAYTFASGTDQITSITTTLPTVTTGQNGSNSANTLTTVYDSMGRAIWSKDEAGFLTYIEYDAATGAMAKTISDVDVTQTTTFANLPSGWTTPAGGGLHLTSTFEVDSLGRVTKETTPEGRVNYTVYNDANREVRTYRGWDSITNLPTGPITVSREDTANGYSEFLTMTATPNVSSGRPTGTESIANVQSLSRSYVNSAGQVVTSDSYFDLSGLTYSTSTSLGTAGVNFYRTQYVYDTNGNRSKVISPEGTIYRTVFDGQGRAISEWVGTDDTPTTGFWSPTNLTGTNMVKVAEYEYDGGGVGDGNLTKTTAYPGGGAADRVTQTWFDWRNRAVAVKAGVEVSESTSVNRPLYYTDYNNLGEVTQTRAYDADGVTPTVTSGVPQPLSSSLLRAQTTTNFDELGRVYRTDTFSVNPSSGTVSTNSLHSDVWYDSRGNVIKSASPNGLVTKMVYDGVGRVTTDYLSEGGGDTGYSDASTVTGDTVIEQNEYTYDKDGNVRATTHRERFHNASGTGALGSPSSGIGARVNYAGIYYDLSNRQIASVDVGTNGGTAWSPLPPSSVPSRSSSTLVTSYEYASDAVQVVRLTGNPTGGTFTLTFGGQTTSAIAYNASAATVQTAVQALASVGSGNAIVTAAPGGGWQVRFAGTLAAKFQVKMTASGTSLTGGTSPAVVISTLSAGGDAGEVATVTDPKGLVSRTYSDSLGRTTQTVQNFTTGAMTDTSNITTNYGYNSVGMTSLTAALANGGVQTTGYVYGVTSAGGNGIDSNDAVAATQHPDPTTGAASGAQQETVKVNALGEVLTSTDRNGSVHTLTYDILGRVVSDAVTTLGSGVDGSVRRIETAYDSLGNVLKVTSYDAATSGNIVNQILRDFNGFGQMSTEWQSHSGAVNTLTSPSVQYAFNFNGSGSANQNRLTSVTYPSGYVLTFNYASGLDSDISRLSSLSDSSGTLESYDFLGLGTVVRRAHTQPGVDLTYIKQIGESNGAAGDQYTGLDAFGRVIDQRWIKTSSGTATDRFQYGYDQNSNRTYRDNLVNTAFGELYTYDDLNQIATFDRGTLNGGKTGLTGAASRSQSWDYDALGNWDSVTTGGSTQTRTANAQNEITSISGATTPTFDANGNMTGDETGRQFVYDAWNRLVVVKNSGGTTLETFGYDGLNRRVTQTVSGTTTDLYYSDGWQVLEERVSGATTTQYVWSPIYVDAMILRDRDTNADGSLDERLWVQQDANFNVTALVDGSGAVVERYAYDSFGSQTIYDASYTSRGSSSYAWTHGFQGLRYDAISGLNAAHYRWYSPTLGRWVSSDPIRFAGGDENLYAFGGSNPANRVDPSGLVAFVAGDGSTNERVLPSIPIERPSALGYYLDWRTLRAEWEVVGANITTRLAELDRLQTQYFRFEKLRKAELNKPCPDSDKITSLSRVKLGILKELKFQLSMLELDIKVYDATYLALLKVKKKYDEIRPEGGGLSLPPLSAPYQEYKAPSLTELTTPNPNRD